MRYILFTICLFVVLNVNAQKGGDSLTKDGKTYVYVEHMPVSPYSLGEYLSKNLHYPEKARKHNVEGRVIVKFVVGEDGSISDCTLVKGISKDCDKEALRVVRAMPPWKPGMNKGIPVKVYYNLPIVFKLTD